MLMIKIVWAIGLILFVSGYYFLLQKTIKYREENENFDNLLKRNEDAKKDTEDTSLGSGSKFICALLPFINLIFGLVMWGIVLSNKMWERYTDLWFEKF